MSAAMSMDECTMDLDAVDAAFLRRLGPFRESPPTPVVPTALVDEPPAPAPAARREQCGLVDWLLAAVPDQWDSLAGHVERAVARGCRVIAVAGGRRGEGRTTIVGGLVATLRSRGWLASSVNGPHVQPENAPSIGCETNQVVIVDAGIWFPPGPIRRERVLAMSQGCDAVILVRQASIPPLPARAAAI